MHYWVSDFFQNSAFPQSLSNWLPHLYSSIKQTLVFACIVSVCIFPWIVRNKIVTGKAMRSTVFAINFIIISAPYTLAELDGRTGWRPWTSLHCEYFERFVTEVQRDHPEWSASLRLDGSNDLERLSPKAQQAWKIQGVHTEMPVFAYMNPIQLEAPVTTAWRIILGHPFAFLKSHLRGVVRRWLKPRQPWFVDLAFKKLLIEKHQRGALLKLLFHVVQFIWIILYYGVLLAAAAGFWKLKPPIL